MQMYWRQRSLPNTYNQMFSRHMKRMVTTNYKKLLNFLLSFAILEKQHKQQFSFALRHEA